MLIWSMSNPMPSLAGCRCVLLQFCMVYRYVVVCNVTVLHCVVVVNTGAGPSDDEGDQQHVF